MSPRQNPSPLVPTILLTCLISTILFIAAPLAALEGSDRCEDAPLVTFGQSLFGELTTASNDGESSCDGGPGVADRWYRFEAPTGEGTFVLGAIREDLMVSIHTGCPGSTSNQLTCGYGPLGYLGDTGLRFVPTAGETYYVRLAERSPDGAPIDFYDLSLTPGGVITGLVTDEVGVPLPDVPVSLSSNAGNVVTDEEGRYRFSGLDPRDFYVLAGFDTPYVAELYNNIPCLQGLCYFFFFDPSVTATPGVTRTVDFSLALGGAITGRVTDASTGVGLANQPVTIERLDIAVRQDVLDDFEPIQFSVHTDADGDYRFEGLTADEYAVWTDVNGYQRQYWDNQSCNPTLCSISLATPIAIELGQTVDAIDFALERGLSIGGQLRDADTGDPLAGGVARLLDADGETVDVTSADFSGVYIFDSLVAGDYYVSTASSRYINEIWPGVPCPKGGDCPIDAATLISLGTESVDGIDFELELGGTLGATVISELSGLSVENPLLAVYNAAGDLVSTGVGFNGTADVSGLQSGEYRAIAFSINNFFLAELYEEVDCPDTTPDSCGSVLAGTPITVTAGEQTTVDFSLEQLLPTCEPDFETLCLNEGRFAVKARWQTPDGSSSVGISEPLPGIDDSGAFVFFSQSNVEMLVKVLDACDFPFNRFWVFAAGLTNVQVEMTVTDTLTGAVKTYSNPQGAAFQPIQDTDAFNTCTRAEVGPPDPMPLTADAESMLEQVQAELAETQRRLRTEEIVAERIAAEKTAESDSSESDSSPSPAPQKADCTPSATELCLGEQGRFRVEATWRTPTGETGDGQAVPFRRDTGLFWFFDQGNVELVVKVLDACAPPFDRFWVFASGLTNVEVDLRVTDTMTDEVRVYRNAQAQSFQPIQDTDAFATCQP